MGISAIFAALKDFWGDVCNQEISDVENDSGGIEHNIQLGVPQREVVKESSPMILARPKSASFTVRSLSIRRIFSGLISL